MKTYKLLLLFFISFLATNCALEEEPPYLANVNVYNSASNAAAAVEGIYNNFVGYDYYGNSMLALTYYNSGDGVSKKQNSNTSPDNAILGSLKATSNTSYLKRVWSSAYSMIARSNDAITSAKATDSPSSSEEMGINDAIGQAYFLRAFNYFNLVRLWGEVPLRLSPANAESFNSAKSSIPDIYSQIIQDAKAAQKYMNGSIGNGTAQVYAADMLLAKVYMALATAPSSLIPETANYWQLAYNEAIKVYGKYSLVSDYDGLFRIATGNNTSESILEIKSSATATLDHTRSFTPSWTTQVKTFGNLKANVAPYERHRTAYPNDPRIDVTYISTWTRTNNGSNDKSYPDVVPRVKHQKAFPSLFKLGSRDVSNTTRETTKGFKIYRYADLLLMLSEISNELQNGEQLGYVNEVLARVGLTPRVAYSGGQEAFRDAIMEEYSFELCGEAHSWFNYRRRGYNYFLNKIILPHNNHPLFNPSIDVTLDTDENVIMYLPISQDEIDTNLLISE
jgi:hypothetical protein